MLGLLVNGTLESTLLSIWSRICLEPSCWVSATRGRYFGRGGLWVFVGLRCCSYYILQAFQVKPSVYLSIDRPSTPMNLRRLRFALQDLYEQSTLRSTTEIPETTARMGENVEDPLTGPRFLLSNDDIENKLRFIEKLHTLGVSRYVDLPQVSYSDLE